MFSLFEDGITDTICKTIIGLPELRQMIRNNPYAEKIAKIRQLRKIGDEYYKVLKSELPNITPNCIVSERNLDEEHINNTLKQFSQYIYFDIDGKDNPEEYKSYFVEKYGHLATMICISSGYGGISALFKIRNQITIDNFNTVWDYVRYTVLSGETVDPHCKGIGRAMFISHDPEVYCNFDNEIEVSISATSQYQLKKEVNQYKTCKQNYFRLNSPSSVLDINVVLGKLRTRTLVEHPSPVVDFLPLEYTEVFFQKDIPDGTKHRTYTSMIHTLVYLNPEIERQYIFSYLFFINEQHAKPKMEKRELIRLFNTVFEGIKNNGVNYVNTEIKWVHFNPDCRLSKADKISISNMLNGARRKNKTIEKIIAAKHGMEQAGQKITQNRIAKLTKLSSKTIRRHLNSNLIDIDELVQMINDTFAQEPISKLSIGTNTVY